MRITRVRYYHDHKVRDGGDIQSDGDQHHDIYTTAPGNYIANGYLDPLKDGPH